MTCGLQREDRVDLGGMHAGFPASPSQSGHGLRRAVDTDHDAPNTGIYSHDEFLFLPGRHL
jgi:hypothetical protein